MYKNFFCRLYWTPYLGGMFIFTRGFHYVIVGIHMLAQNPRYLPTAFEKLKLKKTIGRLEAKVIKYCSQKTLSWPRRSSFYSHPNSFFTCKRVLVRIKMWGFTQVVCFKVENFYWIRPLTSTYTNILIFANFFS